MRNERAFEDRRVTDVKAKLDRLVGRLRPADHSATHAHQHHRPRSSSTRRSTGCRRRRSRWCKDFMKSGKPVLACLGPNSEPNVAARLRAARRLRTAARRSRRSSWAGRRSCSTSESKGFAARQAGNMLGGAPSEIPPVTFPEPPAGKKAEPDRRGDARDCRERRPAARTAAAPSATGVPRARRERPDRIRRRLPGDVRGVVERGAAVPEHAAGRPAGIAGQPAALRRDAVRRSEEGHARRGAPRTVPGGRRHRIDDAGRVVRLRLHRLPQGRDASRPRSTAASWPPA